jgi:hypothetical protein
MKQIVTVMLAVFAMAAMAAETVIEIKDRSNISAYGNAKYYLTQPVVTVADGVAKAECVKTAADAKPISYQFAIRSKEIYKAGMTYTITFTLKSNKDVTKASVANFQMGTAPYKIFGRTPISLKANEPKEFTISASLTEDVTVATCIPCLHMPLTAGQTIEISNVKISETPTK